MSLIQEIKEIKASPKELRKFGFTLGTAFLILALYILIKKDANVGYFIFGFTAVIIGGAIFKPASLINFYKMWMSLALCLSWVMTRVILSVLFYVGFTIIKILAKIFGKEFLDLKIDKNRKSYWIKREQKQFDKDSFERQF